MLHVSLLGEQAIIDDATGSVRTRSSRTVALLAFLAAHAGAPQPRQRIAGQFWPDSTDAQALTNLRRELHHLRQALGDEPSLVVTTRDLYWQDTTTCRVDIRTFDMERTAALAAEAADDSDGVLAHASVAIGEYRGDLLPGVYDDWLLEARSELERQCVGLCDLACATRRRTGDLTGAVDAARRRLQLAPLEETGYRTLMQLQADLGDRQARSAHTHHCASILERELGVSPDPATEQTFQRIMAQADPAGARATPVESAVGAVRVRDDRACGPVCGSRRAARPIPEHRDPAAPVSLWSAAGPASARPAWWPRSRAFARQQGAVVAGTQCFGKSGRLALAPVADWIRNPAVQSATATLDPAWRAEVGRLVPPEGRGDRSGQRLAVNCRRLAAPSVL